VSALWKDRPACSDDTASQHFGVDVIVFFIFFFCLVRERLNGAWLLWWSFRVWVGYDTRVIDEAVRSAKCGRGTLEF